MILITASRSYKQPPSLRSRKAYRLKDQSKPPFPKSLPKKPPRSRDVRFNRPFGALENYSEDYSSSLWRERAAPLIASVISFRETCRGLHDVRGGGWAYSKETAGIISQPLEGPPVPSIRGCPESIGGGRSPKILEGTASFETKERQPATRSLRDLTSRLTSCFAWQCFDLVIGYRSVTNTASSGTPATD